MRSEENMSIHKTKDYFFQFLSIAIITVFLVTSFVPILMGVFMSLKTNAQILGDFWGLPFPVMWSNYSSALFGLAPYMLNTLIVVLVSAMGVVFISCLSGFVFAHLQFPFKNALYMTVLAVMMVPGVVTLASSYSLIINLRLKDTWFALWFPYLAGGQVMGILLCRTFIASQPKELFEAARIDGSSEIRNFLQIVIPLAQPILVTLAIMNTLSTYNDYIWPLLVVSSRSKMTLMVAVTGLVSETGAKQMGVQTAGYIFASLPLLMLFVFGMKYYVSGLTSGAIKA
jgi:ABC-type glycerol-3-phosphate transport system permease component